MDDLFSELFLYDLGSKIIIGIIEWFRNALREFRG